MHKVIKPSGDGGGDCDGFTPEVPRSLYGPEYMQALHIEMKVEFFQ
jgi:hypothetical protein